MRHLLIVLIFISGLAPDLLAQQKETGIPFIDNFTPKEYNANTQNWAIVQDHRGVMYFGNNKGVLEYDGVNWRLIPVSNHSIVRSLAINSAGTIFVGAVGEFGYLAPDETGQLQYNSLVQHIPKEEAVFADVWTTLVKDDEVYFQSFYSLYRYKNGKIKSWPLSSSYHRSFIVFDKLYLREEGKGLMVMEGDSLRQLQEGGLFAAEPVSAMLPFQDNILVGSRNKGLFLLNPESGTIRPFRSQLNTTLGKYQVYHGVVLSNGHYAFSTIKGGVVVINREGKGIVGLGQQSGLLSETVYYLYPDRNGSLWLGLANGISKVEITSPLSIFNKILGLDGGILAIKRFKGTLYVNTHQGIFFLNKDSHFQQLEGLFSQCWYMETFTEPGNPDKKHLLVASTVGVFEVEQDKARLVLPGRAVVVKTSRSDPSRVLVGFNGYISSLKFENGDWKEETALQIGHEEIRSLEEDNEGNLWMGTMFAGVYKLKMTELEAFFRGENSAVKDSIKVYGTAQGLPTENWNYFHRVGQRLIVSTQQGIYKYNKEKDRFEKDSLINAAFGEGKRWFYYLNEDHKGDLWFDSDKGKGVLLKQSNGTYLLSENPFKRIIVSPENQVTGFNDVNGIAWFGTPDGLFRYDSHHVKTYSNPFEVLVRQVVVSGDSTVFHGTFFEEAESQATSLRASVSLEQPASFRHVLDYGHNSIAFHYAAPVFDEEGVTQYSFYLEGYDKGWSAWSGETKKEYTNLPEGKYMFKIKAKNFYETISQESVYAFTVLPPWYRTPLSYGAFAVLLAGLVFSSARVYSSRLKKDNQRLEAVVQSRTAKIQQQKERIERQKNEVEKSYQNVTTLSRIGQQITANLDFHSITYTLYNSIEALMSTSSFGVGLYKEESQSIFFESVHEDRKEIPAFSIPLNREDNLAVWCFINRKEVFINDPERELGNYLSSLPTVPPAGKCFSQSIIYLPLQVKNRVIGVISVQSFSENAYQMHHLDILRTLAAYAAIAIDNSSAYLQLNETNEELLSTLENLKQTQTQLVQSEKMASLGQLTAGVAHEINNPINFVSAGISSLSANYHDLNALLQKYNQLKAGGDNEKILQELEELKNELELEYLLEEIPQLLSSIREGAQRTTEIVKSLRNFTRLDEDQLKQTNVHEGLDSTLIILRNQLGNRIELIREYTSLPTVTCYPGQLNQVFMNLLTNALQAIEGEGKVWIRTALEGKEIKISICDNGKGMSEAVKNRIFEPFYTTKEVGEGTGLGLSISYGIIEKHKGKIEVESTEGEGTSFHIYLPIKQ